MMEVAPAPRPNAPESGLLQKWRRITWSERAFLCEAMAMLLLSSVAIAMMRFRFIARTAAWGGCNSVLSSEERLAIAHRVRWAVLACARRVPWRSVCYQQGLAAQWMLRRRGVPSVLYYGARPDPEKGVAAHVWVRDGEFDVVGGESAEGFAVLATFPAPSGLNPDRALP